MNEDASRNEAIQKAQDSILTAEPLAASDPHRPRYHFHAPAQWMNDPNGPIFHRGWYHLFYQTNPFGELCWGQKAAMVHWGHARSRDLVHWEHLPIAIWPSTQRGEEHCWSGGCVIRDDGSPMIFYTSIGPTHQPQDSAEQWAAMGDADLITWKKHPNNPIVDRKSLGGTRILDWRDPFVFRESGCWYMVTGGHRQGGGGCISLFRSADLERWEFVGIPLEGEDKNWECPALFRLGDRWALTYSPHASVKYYTGQMDFQNCRFEPETQGQFDYGRFLGFYAATILHEPTGRTILWAWMHSQNTGRGWNGCLLLPRVLRLLPDGRIGQESAPEVDSLRRDVQSDTNVKLTGGVRRYAAPGGCAELLMDIRAAEGRFGVRLLSLDGQAAEVVCTRDGVTVAGDAVPASELAGGRLRQLHIFVDRSLLEVFIDGRMSVSRWMDTQAVEVFELFAEGGSVDLDKVQIWQIEEAEGHRHLAP